MTANSTILIVDDNLDNLRLLSDMLGKQGYTTRRAISGTLALQSLAVTQFDLILLDITMPDMNGYQVCEQLKQDERFAQIPVIFISALNDVLDKVKAFQVGGADYITKPFQLEEVLARVENQLKIINLQQQLHTANEKLTHHNQILQQSNDRYLKNSLIDPITNFKTRIAFVGQLRQHLKEYANNEDFFAFLIIQCDRLKLYKSMLLSEAENQCLIYISDQIKSLVPESSILGRLNETEFAVFIENINVANIDEILHILDKIQQKLKLPFTINQQEYFLNPSCGIVIGDKIYQQPEQILCDARHALFYAQTQGYGNYQIFDQEIQIQTLISSELKLNFIKTLIAKELPIEYQRIKSLKSSKTVALEANIAWTPVSGNLIALEKIGYLATETGFISQLNQYLFSTICQKIYKYQKLKGENTLENSGFVVSNVQIRVNLSSWQFLQSDLSGLLAKIISKYEIEPKQLAIIINEQAFHDNPAIAIKNLKNIQQLSISTSINHLGTYFLALAKEHNLAINDLKIDGLLLKQIHTNPADQEIYQAVIQTAHSLGMTVTADDIRNAEQLDYLRNLNCEFGQGKWISQII